MSAEPVHECIILDNETEVIVSPKLRTKFIPAQKPEQPSKESFKRTSPKQHLKRLSSTSIKSGDSQQSSKTSDSSHDSVEGRDSFAKPWGWKELVPWILGVQKLNARLREDPEHSIFSGRRSNKYSDKHFPSGLNFLFRVQSLKVNFDSDNKPRLGKDGPPDSSIDDKSLLLQQPNIVFVNHEDIREQTYVEGLEIPSVFIAKLTKLRSPKEDIDFRALQQKRHKQQEDKNSKSKDVKKVELEPNSDELESCYVTVVVIDKKSVNVDKHLEHLILTVKQEQPCLQGHVIIPSLLRRLLELSVTRKVWLQVVTPPPSKVLPLQLHPVSGVVSIALILILYCQHLELTQTI